MKNSINKTTNANNLNTTEMKTKINFLKEGTYDILEVTKEDKLSGESNFIAKVRRWESTSLLKGIWKNETVDLSYLFTKDSNGPKLRLQPEGLANHVIDITSRIPHTVASGKTYNSYNWKINKELTATLQENFKEGLNYLDNLDYQEELEAINYQNSRDWDDEMFIQEHFG